MAQQDGTAHAFRRVRATVLFADITGFTRMSAAAGPEAAYSSVTGCLRLLDEIARRHGGSVDKYLGDCLMVLFGFPVPLHDAPHAAIEAALEMRQCVRSHNRDRRLDPPLDIQIGVNTGEMTVGDVSGSVIREFAVMGDAVNVAARLRTRAGPGRIYVGDATHEEAGGAFVCRRLQPLELEGRRGRVTAFEVVAPQTAASRRRIRRPLQHSERVGAGDELEQLRRAVSDLAGGRGGVVHVTGPLAIGKSRLVADARATSEAKNLLWLEAGAPSLGHDEDLQPFAELVCEWADVGEDDREQAAREKLDRAASELGVDRSRVHRELRALIGLGRPGRGPLVRGGRGTGRERLRAALLAWVAQLAARERLVLVFDDLQLADGPTLSLIGELLPLAAELPVLFVLVATPDPGPECDGLIAHAREQPGDRYREIRLSRLDRTASLELIDRLDVGAAKEDGLRELIASRAAGNPGDLVTHTFLAPALAADRERALEASRSVEAERRRATVLFADLSGFTSMSESLDPAFAYRTVSDCLRLLDGIARKHGGSVDKHHGDCIMAVFGAPVAIEDAPRAAINAAIEMRDLVDEYSREHELGELLELHIGINTGRGIAGDISGPLIKEFALMGDAVTVASRLMEGAPRGSIYVGEETHRYTAPHFEYRPLAPVRIEGSRDSTRSYELLSKRARIHRERPAADRALASRLVGRQAQLELLQDAVAAAASGRGGVVSLIGEAGLGKSRLLEELRKSEAGQSVRFVVGRSVSIGHNLSFHPFADFIRSWCGTGEGDAEERAFPQLERAVERLCGDEAGDMLPFIATLAGMHLPPRHLERLDGIRGEALEKLILSHMKSLLQRMANERPLVVVLEDLHWADTTSIELLERLLRVTEHHPLLFLNLCRPDYPETTERVLEYVRAHHAERGSEIRLEPLTADDTQLLIDNLFHHGEVPAATRKLIGSKAAGNPFYVEEVIRSLLTQGALESVDGRLHATSLIHGVEIPGTIEEVVMARIDRLDPEQRQLLQTAAVIGQSGYWAVLHDITGSGVAVEASLTELEEAQLLVAGDDPGRMFAFKHPLIQEVAYESILRTRRQDLHLRVAEAIRETVPDGQPGYAGMLAYHFSLGGDLERAEEWLFKAGDEATRLAASSEALEFFRGASELYLRMSKGAGDPRKKAELEKSIAVAHFNRGEQIEAVEHIHRYVEHVGAPAPRSTAGLALRGTAVSCAVMARLYLPALRGKRRATREQAELVDLMFKRARAQTTTAPGRFVSDTLEIMHILWSIDPHTMRGSGGIFSGNAGYFAYAGMFGMSERFLVLARDYTHEQDLPEEFVYRVFNFVHHFLKGDWDSRHEVEQELIDDALAHGLLWDASTYLGLHAKQMLYQGQFDRAAERIEELRKIEDVFAHGLARENYQGCAAFLALERGRIAEALAACDVYYKSSDELLPNLLALGTKAKALVLAGELDDARATLARAEELMRPSFTLPAFQLSSYLRSRLLLEATELEAASRKDRRGARRLGRRAARTARRALRSSRGAAWRGPESARLAGRVAWLRGRRRRAFAYWVEALREARRLGMRPELGRTHAEISRRLAESDSPGQQVDGLDLATHAARAREIFSALDLQRDLAELENT